MAVFSSRLWRGQQPSFGAVQLCFRLPRLHAITLHSTKPAPNKAVYSTAGISPSQYLSEPVPNSMDWQSLQAPSDELKLDFTLPTGQSFRWRRTGEAEFTGVVDNRVVKVQQLSDDVQYQVMARGAAADTCEDAAVLRDYFNLQACKLKDLCQEWSSRDERFRKIHIYFPGARVLRQDPVECLFEFICSSNNHISRIHGMVERLCCDYGTPLLQCTAPELAGLDDAPSVEAEGPAEEEQQQQQQAGVPDLAFYAFPSLEQLSSASEAALRAQGFGYRAKFITGSVQALLAKPGGGRQWLLSLRDVPYREASEALCELPGIGPKVAACICLFALDKYEAIPVDTHVWQLAVRYYTPHLKGKTMNKKIMGAVEQAFIERFGPWAGWAHNTLFISELASQRERLPAHLQPGAKVKPKPAPKAPKLDPPAGVDDQAALELCSLAPSDSIVAKGTTSKKRRLVGTGPKAATGKAWDQAVAAEGSVKIEGRAAAKGLVSHGGGLGSSEDKVSQRGRRAKSKPRATRSIAAHVDQAVEDGVQATQVLTKRKR